jgi:hypothetical protein
VTRQAPADTQPCPARQRNSLFFDGIFTAATLHSFARLVSLVEAFSLAFCFQILALKPYKITSKIIVLFSVF